MGYRSEVAIAIYEKDYQDRFVNEGILKDLLDNVYKTDVITREDGDIRILYWDWVKWNRLCDDVQKFDELLDQLFEEDHPYSFVRLGESGDDVEEIHRPDANGNDFSSYIYPVNYINLPI